MSGTPELLRYENRSVIPDSVFTDLQLTGLLPEGVRRVLARPCGKAEIPRRQELFSWLYRPENEKRLTDLLPVLREYERAVFFYRESGHPAEKLHIRLKLLRTYADVCDLLGGFTDCGVLLSDMAACFGSPERRRQREALRRDLAAAGDILRTADEFNLSFADKNWITPGGGAVIMYDKIAACAESLGLDMPPPKETRSHADMSLSDAYFLLFAENISAVDGLLADYAGLDLSEPAKYITELSFYSEILALKKKAAEIRVPVCFPRIGAEKQFTSSGLYDISLLLKQCDSIVPNGAWFTESERFFFLTGANGGGKTTYLRAVGINLLLALSGCPVFAKDACVYPFSGVLTHFPADERFTDSGRLDEEAARAERMLADGGEDMFMLFNETFSGTDDLRGFELLKSTVERIRQAGISGLYVTHFHEAENAGCPVLSALVDERDGNRRTFRIVRKTGGTSSFAADILKKYRLDRESLDERRRENGI